jgi:hypothetical protein
VTESDPIEEWLEKERVKELAMSMTDSLDSRFGMLPPELTAAIHDTTNSAKLREWIKLAVKVASLDEFRAAAGI